MSCNVNIWKEHFSVLIKYLGVVIDSELKWTDHINELSSQLSSRLYILRKLRKKLPYNNFKCIYYAIFQSCIDYCLSVWGSTSEKHLNHLQKLQKRAARIVTQNFNWDESSINNIRNLGWQTIRERYEFLTCCITYKARNNTEQSLSTETQFNKSSLSYSGANLWNSLPMHIRDSPTYNTFKSRLKKLQKSKPHV